MFGILTFFFFFKNILTLLYLNRGKVKGQYGKNITLISTKILPKKYGHFPC